MRVVVAATLAVVLATATTCHADRNNASEIVRGGTWLYHMDAGPCGVDENRTLCQFEETSPAITRATSVTLSVSSELINHLDALSVTMRFASFKVGSKDWIGAYCLDSEAQEMDDRQYLDYQYVGANPTSLAFGPLVNMRCLWQFRYFTYSGSNAYVKLATSPFVQFAKGPQEPLHVRVAKTAKPTEMRVMWTSAASPRAVVQYGASPSSLSFQAAATGDTYAASDMCQSPATTVAATWFRDPGVMYTAVMTGLAAESTYYYRVCSTTSGPCSNTFKLKTPPAPGAQNGVASFFVYGDLGDWNVHATGPLPVKRSATTIQLMRRDMDATSANYVAIMHDGDLAYAMGKTYLWDQFGALIEPVASEIPYMVGIGNHEYCYDSGGANDPSGAGATNGFHPLEGNYGRDSNGECGVPTNKRFIMPNNGNKIFWWSTEIGLVHHTQISSEHDYTPGSVMYKWLENDLKSVDRKKTPWLMLHLHRPMYTSEAYESDNRVSLLIRKSLEPLLGKYRVDAVFSGHYHAYELTCPVFDGSCRAESAGVGLMKAQAPFHIMVGSAGADVDNVGYYDVPWRLDAQLEYGYGRVHVHNATHAKWEFVRNRDEIVASSVWMISDHDWVV
jgi:acid phosphatase type 7